MKINIFILLFLLAFSSCKQTSSNQTTDQTALVQQYMDNNAAEMLKT